MINYKLTIKIVLAILYAVVVCVVLPVLVYERNRHFSAKVEAWFVGNVITLFSNLFNSYSKYFHYRIRLKGAYSCWLRCRSLCMASFSIRSITTSHTYKNTL